MSRFFVVILAVSWSYGFSQFDSLGINTPWSKGSITHVNGAKIVGYIQNNEKLHLIRCKPDLSTEENAQLINEDKIVTMEYYDAELKKLRRFASINYKINVSAESLSDKAKHLSFKGEDTEDVALFEILMEYEQFAALSKVSKVDLALRQEKNSIYDAATGNFIDLGSRTKKIGIEYYEEFYFFDDSGKLYPVLILNYLERDKENFLYKKYKPNLNRSVIKKHMWQYWEQVEEYLDKNDLRMKVKDDFLKLLEYYKELEA